MKNEFQTRAVILREIDHGESDKIITFYSLNSGRLTCIAKGAKRSKKRFVNKLELFTALDLTYVSKGEGLSRLEQAETVTHFPKLRFDSRRYLGACLVAEVLLYWVKENDPDPECFALISSTLERLSAGNVEQTLILFFSRFLTIQGFRPVLDVCTGCGRPVAPKCRYTFHAARFGLVCEACIPPVRGSGMALSLASIKLLHRLQNLPADKMERFHFNQQSKKEAFAVFRSYFVYLLHRDIHSWQLAEEVLLAGEIKTDAGGWRLDSG